MLALPLLQLLFPRHPRRRQSEAPREHRQQKENESLSRPNHPPMASSRDGSGAVCSRVDPGAPLITWAYQQPRKSIPPAAAAHHLSLLSPSLPFPYLPRGPACFSLGGRYSLVAVVPFLRPRAGRIKPWRRRFRGPCGTAAGGEDWVQREQEPPSPGIPLEATTTGRMEPHHAEAAAVAVARARGDRGVWTTGARPPAMGTETTAAVSSSSSSNSSVLRRPPPVTGTGLRAGTGG